MGTWKYRYRTLSGVEIHEAFLEIHDDDRLEVIKRIQKLRIRLNNRGFQFIDAAPIDGVERDIARKLVGLKRFKKPSRVKSSRYSSVWICLVFLMLFALLWLLASW